MSDKNMQAFQRLFASRLATLNHILDVSADYFHNDREAVLQFRLVDTMLPFGTQIAYTCDQPYNFALWCEGKPADHLSPEVPSIERARQLIEETKAHLMQVDLQDEKLTEIKRIELAGGRYIDLPGLDYINDFLLPNFYFHLVTAYNIMRMKGVALGKENYMMHVVPLVKQM